MNRPAFYALVLIEEDGNEQFGGAYVDRRTAQQRGARSGKRFEVRPAYIH